MVEEKISYGKPTGNPNAEPVRFRARDLGIEIGVFLPGGYNAITDVPHVLVGQKTVWKNPGGESHRVRSGVTAILTDVSNMFEQKSPCAIYLGNAFGKLIGYTQVKELGTLETPILLTGTSNVPKVADALIEYMLFNVPGNENVRSINPVVGETDDGSLNDLRARPVEREDVFNALADAKIGPVLEGSVGAGTGTHCLGWKGGIGTSSRVLPTKRGGYNIGVLVQTNFGGLLTVNGAPVGRKLGRFSHSGDIPYEDSSGNSCMVIVATDAPLCARNLERLAKRAMYGLVQSGSYSSNGSGDYLIVFSTAYTMPYDGESVSLLDNSDMSLLFLATEEAAEEAVLNSMCMATTVVGRDDNTYDAIPLEDVIKVCEQYDALFYNSKVAPWAPTTKVDTVKNNASRLDQLEGYVSSADIPDGTKSSLLAKLDAAIEKNSDALSLIREGKEQQANNALKACSNQIEAFKNEVEADSLVQEPYRSMFASRADLGTWICDKAIALPIG